MFNNLKIIGTSHISEDSIKEVKAAVKDFKPEIIAVELDKKRYYSLNVKVENTGLPKISRVGFSGFLFLIIGRFLQKKLGSIVGVDPGSEMKTAVDICKKQNLMLALIDRDIELTLRRFSKLFTFREKMRILKDLIIAPFSREKIHFDISKVPKKELIKKLMEELKRRYPNIYRVLIDERNTFMAKKLFLLSRQHPDKKILCVIGAGHEEGLLEELKKLYYSNVSF
ncbi:MAG: TraB family protein [archaeon]